VAVKQPLPTWRAIVASKVSPAMTRPTAAVAMQSQARSA
jgi:hypothetical protein